MPPHHQRDGGISNQRDLIGNFISEHSDFAGAAVTEYIENAVIPAIKAHVDVLLDYEEMKLAQMKKGKASAKSLETKIATEKRAVETLEASITKIFTSLASGKITQDIFLQKKSAINETIDRKRSQIEKWAGQLHNLTIGRSQSENSVAELKHLRTLDKLNREIVDMLIEKILVFPNNHLEIVWKIAGFATG